MSRLTDAVISLGFLIDVRRSLEEAVEKEHEDVLQLIKARQAEMARIESEIEALRASMVSPNTEELEQVRSDINAKMQEIRREAHSLPVEQLSDTNTLRSGSALVRISKVAPSIRFDANKMLKERPELQELKLDGEPAFNFAISPSAVERLVLSGKIEREWVDQFKTQDKPRAPSVTIEEIRTERGDGNA